MTDHSKASRRFDDSELYDALRAVAKEVGHPPTTGEYREHRTNEMPTDATIQRRHDDSERPWLSALTEAGLEPDPANHGGVPADTDRVVFVLNELRDQLGHWPSPDEYREVGALPSVPTIYDRYGSWPEAIDIARSIGDTAPGRDRKYSDADCLDALRQYADERGTDQVWRTDYSEWANGRNNTPGAKTISDYIGTFRAAVQEAGLSYQGRYHR